MKVLGLCIGICCTISVHAQSKFESKIKKAEIELICPMPGESNPVTLNTAIIEEQDSVAIVMKVKFASGWHIYSLVPKNSPYIPMELILKIPENITVVGEWIKSPPTTSVEYPNILLYEHEALFVQKLTKNIAFTKGENNIITGLYYQTCNSYQCLPPEEIVVNLNL